jgi:hypothetical protein
MSTDVPTPDEVILIYDQIKDWVDKTKAVNASNIIILVTLLIKCVENLCKDKSGTYKKDLVLKVLTKVVSESDLEPDAKASLMILIQTSIPVMIDTMISIAHENIDLGKVKEKLSGCFCV